MIVWGDDQIMVTNTSHNNWKTKLFKEKKYSHEKNSKKKFIWILEVLIPFGKRDSCAWPKMAHNQRTKQHLELVNSVVQQVKSQKTNVKVKRQNKKKKQLSKFTSGKDKDKEVFNPCMTAKSKVPLKFIYLNILLWAGT